MPPPRALQSGTPTGQLGARLTTGPVTAVRRGVDGCWRTSDGRMRRHISRSGSSLQLTRLWL
jgi:hypothetical protein